MSNFYTRLQVVCDPDWSEILMAEIAEAGFDTFMETGDGFEAFAEEEKANLTDLEAIKEKYSHLNSLLFSLEKVEKQNWNEEWEKNVDPIFVDDTVLVRASFHDIKKSYPIEIVITPKMSFGTGHHQTTHLMLSNQLKVDHKGKHVMDAGCGTAILSVMASKLGATHVEGFDIDEWSVVNGNENAEVNNTPNINIRQGTISELSFSNTFDIILANINKNVLLAEMELYVKNLKASGTLIISGFYTHDIDDLLKAAGSVGLTEVSRAEKETWASVILTNNSK